MAICSSSFHNQSVDDFPTTWPEIERRHFLAHTHDVAENFDLYRIPILIKLLMVRDAHCHRHKRAFRFI